MAQDNLAVLSMFDAILARFNIERPNLTEIWFMSDNAKFYQNNMLPVASVFIAAYHGIYLKGMIHPEKVCWKSTADAHFAISIRQLHRFVRETESDVTTPVHVVEGLK